MALAAAALAAGSDFAAAPGQTQSAPVKGIVAETDAITIPQLINYQGRLTDTAGRAVPDGQYAVTFKLYDTESGGGPFWTESQNVRTKSGLFVALLGSVTPISYIPDYGDCWVELQVPPDPAMSPRLRLASVPYAYYAGTAQTADSARPRGTSGGDLTGSYPSPLIGTGKVNSAKIQDGSIHGVDFFTPCSIVHRTAGNPYAALMISAYNTSNGIRIDTADNNGIVVTQTGGTGVVVLDVANTGVYAYRCGTYGVRGSGVIYGGYFQAESARGIALYARSYQGVAADTAIRAAGKGLASGGWSTGFDDGSEGPSVVSPERLIVASGSARLNSGSADISLPEMMTRYARPDVPIRLSVTATEDAPGLLVAERRESGFSVRLRRIAGLDGNDNAAFDWIAVAVLKEPSQDPVPESGE
jgi:DUF971 family protein